MDQTVDRLVEGDHRAGEDCEHDEQTGDSLARLAAQEERDSEWDRGECVAGVVDQVGE